MIPSILQVSTFKFLLKNIDTNDETDLYHSKRVYSDVRITSSRRHSAMVLSTSIGNSVVAVATDYDAIGIGA